MDEKCCNLKQVPDSKPFIGYYIDYLVKISTQGMAVIKELSLNH